MPSSNKGASAIVKENNQLCQLCSLQNSLYFHVENEVVTNFMDDLSSVCYFFCQLIKTSAVFEKFIDFHKKDLKVCESNRTHIIGLSKTRWVE